MNLCTVSLNTCSALVTILYTEVISLHEATNSSIGVISLYWTHATNRYKITGYLGLFLRQSRMPIFIRTTIVTLLAHAREGVKQSCQLSPSVSTFTRLNNCCTRQWHGDLMYVYLMETKAVHSSAFPALFFSFLGTEPCTFKVDKLLS